MSLLSKISGNPTVRSLRDKKEAALREEGFAWVPNLGSFLKLFEVGVSPYLGFIHSLSTLSMFELNKAVRGCLIDPKTWDRIVGNFLKISSLSVTVQKISGFLGEIMY